MADAPAAAEAPPAKSGGALPLLLGLNSVLLLAVLGVLVWTQVLHPAKPKAEAQAAEGHGAEEGKPGVPSGPGPTVKLPDFVIRLRNPEADRFARMTFELEVPTDQDKDRLTPRLPAVRDAFIAYLSDRTVEELRGSDGITRVKGALEERVKALVPEAKIRALYLTDFVIQ